MSDVVRRVGVVGPLHPQTGGVASFTSWLLEHEAEIGVSFDPFDLWRPAADEIGGQLRLSTLPRQARLVTRYLAWLRGAPMVIHFCASANRIALPRSIVLAALARMSRRRVITHIHNASDLALATTSRGRRAGLRLLAAASHIVVAIAPTPERCLHEISIPAVHVLNPVRLWPDVTRPPARAADDGVQLLAVGAYGRAKGSFDLVEALAEVRRSGVDAHLTFVGKELRRGERQELVDRTKDLGLEGAVAIEGVATREELAERYAGADVVCLPSYLEGLPMTILEAMAFGAPVISTRVGAIADIVEHEETGILVPPGDVPALARAIARLSTDQGLRKKLGAQAAQRVETVAGDAAIVAQWRRLYDRAFAL